jgi:hypothetical protein
MVLNVDDTNFGASAPIEGMNEGATDKPRAAGDDDHGNSERNLENKF